MILPCIMWFGRHNNMSHDPYDVNYSFSRHSLERRIYLISVVLYNSPTTRTIGEQDSTYSDIQQ